MHASIQQLIDDMIDTAGTLVQAVEALEREDFSSALRTLEERPDPGSVLWQAERGTLLRRLGRYEESNQAFFEAARLQEERYTRSVSNEALALAVSDAVRPYRAFAFEAAFFHLYPASIAAFELLMGPRAGFYVNVVAALLTITGYSVNDTIVIFDRVRENLRSMRRDALEQIVNVSVNQTLGRTIITAGTTFLAVLALFLFGGEVLRGFAFTMLVGIVSGTYSTIFIASAIAIILSQRRASARVQAATPSAVDRQRKKRA